MSSNIVYHIVIFIYFPKCQYKSSLMECLSVFISLDNIFTRNTNKSFTPPKYIFILCKYEKTHQIELKCFNRKCCNTNNKNDSKIWKQSYLSVAFQCNSSLKKLPGSKSSLLNIVSFKIQFFTRSVENL